MSFTYEVFALSHTLWYFFSLPGDLLSNPGLLKSPFSVTQLLERIGEVVEQNHLFTSDGPTLGEELESLQQHLESLSSAQSPLENSVNTSHGLKIHILSLNSQKKPKPKLAMISI